MMTKPVKSYEPKELDTLGLSSDSCQWYSRGESFQLKVAESDDDEDEGANVYGPISGEQAMEDAEKGEV
jgi:hypothetical protein